MATSTEQKSTSKHTPGPWSLPHFAQPDVNCECEYVLTDHLMGAVATVHCSGAGNDWKSHGDNPRFVEAVANARLIAAAPDMLDALEAALPVVEFAISYYGSSEAIDALALVRQAIAKAEGRS